MGGLLLAFEDENEGLVEGDAWEDSGAAEPVPEDSGAGVPVAGDPGADPVEDFPVLEESEPAGDVSGGSGVSGTGGSVTLTDDQFTELLEGLSGSGEDEDEDADEEDEEELEDVEDEEETEGLEVEEEPARLLAASPGSSPGSIEPLYTVDGSMFYPAVSGSGWSVAASDDATYYVVYEVRDYKSLSLSSSGGTRTRVVLTNYDAEEFKAKLSGSSGFSVSGLYAANLSDSVSNFAIENGGRAAYLFVYTGNLPGEVSLSGVAASSEVPEDFYSFMSDMATQQTFYQSLIFGVLVFICFALGLNHRR